MQSLQQKPLETKRITGADSSNLKKTQEDEKSVKNGHHKSRSTLHLNHHAEAVKLLQSIQNQIKSK